LRELEQFKGSSSLFRIETFGSEIQQSHLLGLEVCLEVQADMVDLVVFSITLLIDIRTVFDMYGADRLGTKRELILALTGLEDGLWSEWTGLDDTATPHGKAQHRHRPRQCWASWSRIKPRAPHDQRRPGHLAQSADW
jgi:hypothetical protein